MSIANLILELLITIIDLILKNYIKINIGTGGTAKMVLLLFNLIICLLEKCLCNNYYIFYEQ